MGPIMVKILPVFPQGNRKNRQKQEEKRKPATNCYGSRRGRRSSDSQGRLTYISNPKEETGEGNLSLVYVRGLAFRQVVVAALYPDVLHVPAVGVRGGSTGAERTGEQVLYVLQLQALGLWEAAQDEEEAQHHQARVHEEGP